jgi:hypothetical protein
MFHVASTGEEFGGVMLPDSFRLCRRETLHAQTAYIAIIKVGIKQSEIHLLKRAMLVVFMVMNRIWVFLTLYEDDPRILYQSNRVSLAR